jgi:hypothetical protein
MNDKETEQYLETLSEEEREEYEYLSLFYTPINENISDN